MPLKRHIKNWILRRYLSQPNLKCDSLPYFRGRPWPKFIADGPLTIGPECSFLTFRLRSFFTVLPGGSLEIGKGCGFNDGVNICASKRITFGDYSGCGDGVTVLDTHFHPVDFGEENNSAPIIIGRNVWIAQHAMILPGTVIGDHSVIGAHSVVSGNIPSKVLAIGFPARPIRSIKCPDDWVR